jgi:hypothetical protein
MTRTEVLEFLALAGPLAAPLPIFDPSNEDLRFARARVRHQLLPQLQTLQPGLVPHLLSLAEQLREDTDYLDEQATEQLARITVGEEPLLPGTGGGDLGESPAGAASARGDTAAGAAGAGSAVPTAPVGPAQAVCPQSRQSVDRSAGGPARGAPLRHLVSAPNLEPSACPASGDRASDLRGVSARTTSHPAVVSGPSCGGAAPMAGRRRTVWC